jgi:hypothetical protein
MIIIGCFLLFRITIFKITIGSVNLDDNIKVTMTSTKSVIHEEFDSTTMNNDIAIVILRNKIKFGYYYY